ncbi:MAG: iron-sulfur cluster assembly accessory protein [Rhizobacter sp.]|nr:iron-sulfur cluster assembly accessory protein [Chlorobiales bacterium]
MKIEFSETAREKFMQLLATGELTRPLVRLAAGCAGCSGMAVGMDFNARPQDDDVLYPESGFEVLIARDIAEYVDGTKIDYVDNEFGGNFIVENPYGSSACWW